MEWIGLIGKILEFILDRFRRKGRFRTEFKEGKYAVYLSKRGDSPFVDIFGTIQVFNRKSSSTTVYCDSFKVELSSGTDDFPLPEMTELGARNSFLETQKQVQVGASSKIDLSVSARKHYPEKIPDEYLQRQNVLIHVLLKETFEASSIISGEIHCVDVVHNS